MAEFHFEIVETIVGSVIIEADDYEQAVSQANEIYQDGGVSWGDTEHSTHLVRSYE